jgi:hypothetical protein
MPLSKHCLKQIIGYKYKIKQSHIELASKLQVKKKNVN